MGYAKIPNLYKDQTVLMFKKVYAMEKVHGTSAHLTMTRADMTDGKAVVFEFFSGGEKYDNFVKLFDQDALAEAFLGTGHHSITVYGEAYGGKQQAMSHTYGSTLQFIAFDVQLVSAFGMEPLWMSVDNAAAIVSKLGLEFVPYALVPCEVEVLDKLRDAPSEVALRRGITEPKMREGIVIRPPIEVKMNNGDRIVAKHKGEKFSERSSTPKVQDASKAEVLKEAQKIADEWVVMHRLEHVLGKLELDGKKLGPEDTKTVIGAMIEDVLIEGAGEFVDSKEARSAMGRKTAELFRHYLQQALQRMSE